MCDSIDIIISWLNPYDKHWEDEYKNAKLKYKGDNSDNRIEEYSTFKYFLRSVEQNLPFINKIFLVLNDEFQIPDWLNTECKKLKIVFLKDYMPEFILPQFNTFAIEAFYHLIPDLSEKFIFCNDDMIFTKELTKDFFFKNNLPVDIDTKGKYISCNPVDAYNCNRIKRNNSSIFGLMTANTLKYAKQHIDKNICFYENTHMPCPFLKSSWKKWLNTKDLCSIFANSKFREPNQISTILLMRWIRIHYNEFFENKNLKEEYKYIEIHGNNMKEYKDIMDSIIQGKILCINDMIISGYCDDVRTKIDLILNEVFPNKSKYEK